MEHSSCSTISAGILYVVATPIGNLEDISMRALRILKEVDLIASEDTRHTKKLLSHYSISTPLISYYRERESQRTETIVAELLSGKNIALVSDAGTPCIADPGFVLIAKARQCNISVVPIPGASALITALSVSGIPFEQVLFLGFLPSRTSERQRTLKAVKNHQHALVFYESPHRIIASLHDTMSTLGNRVSLVARELTKLHEETLQGPLAEIVEILEHRESLKGEFVVVLEGEVQERHPESFELEDMLYWHKNAGYSLSAAVKKIANELGIKRSKVYQLALECWQESDKG